MDNYQPYNFGTFDNLLSGLGQDKVTTAQDSTQLAGRFGFKKEEKIGNLLNMPNYGQYQESFNQLQPMKQELYGQASDKFGMNMNKVSGLLGKSNLAGSGFFDDQKDLVSQQFGKDLMSADKQTMSLYQQIQDTLSNQIQGIYQQASGFMNSGANMYKKPEKNNPNYWEE